MKTVSNFIRAVFGNIEFNVRDIKCEYLSLGRINGLADVGDKIDKRMDHIFNKRKKILFETCK